MRKVIIGVPLIIILIICNLTFLHAASGDKTAKDLLKHIDDARGLCIYLGAKDGTAAALAKHSALLVHAVSWNDKVALTVQAAVAKEKLQGLVQNEVFSGKKLPYVNAMANVIIVEDDNGVSIKEIERVLTPGGTLITQKGKKWKKADNPYPSNVNEWTHPTCSADGNRVIDESIPFPLGLRWQDGLPLNIGHWASNRGWVTSKGRVFTISMNEFENIPHPGATWGKKEQWLHARSSANGIHLWKIPLGTYDDKGDLNPLNSAPLATDGQIVLCTKEKQLIGVDAISGEIKHSYKTSYKPMRLSYVDGVAVVVSWEAMKRLKMWDPVTKPSSAVWDIWTPSANKGAVEAFDAASGKKIWGEQEVAQTLFITGKTVVYLVQGPAPVKAQFIVARELKTGKELWRSTHEDLGVQPNLFLAGVGEGVAALAHHKKGTDSFKLRCDQLTVISLKDGKKLWNTQKQGDVMVMFAEGNLWYGAHSYDPQSGTVKGRAPINLTRRMCVPPVVVGGVGGTPRSQNWTDIQNKKGVNLGGVRGACVQGVAVSEGRMYVAQNFCRCSPGQLPGFLAMSTEALPSDQDFTQARPVMKGSGRAQKDANGALWPTFRGNAERSGIIDSEINSSIKKAWQQTLVDPSDHPIVNQWKQSLMMPLTAPVATGDLLITASANKGEIYALNASNGKIAWTAQCSARIDSPPTIYKGLCLSPCHDGWVYAFSLSDGALVYKIRIAPQEKRMVSFAQVESSWPVVGSPLVKDDVAYAIAGRSTEMEGGCAVVAFDPLTGKTKWASRVSGDQRCADVLQWYDGALRMQNKRIDPNTGKSSFLESTKDDKKYKANLSGLLDGTWFYVGNRRSGNHLAGKINAEVLLSTEDTWYGFSTYRGNKGVFAIKHEEALKCDPKNQSNGTYIWNKSCEDMRVTALALSKNAVVVGGYVKGKGGLRIIDRNNGKVLAQHDLSAAPVVNGLAIGDGVVASLMDGSVVFCK